MAKQQGPWLNACPLPPPPCLPLQTRLLARVMDPEGCFILDWSGLKVGWPCGGVGQRGCGPGQHGAAPARRPLPQPTLTHQPVNPHQRPQHGAPALFRSIARLCCAQADPDSAWSPHLPAPAPGLPRAQDMPPDAVMDIGLPSIGGPSHLGALGSVPGLDYFDELKMCDCCGR